MTTALQAFAFDSHAVRVVMKDDEPWFIAKDVVACLELEWKTGGAGSTGPLDDDEKSTVSLIDSRGIEQALIAINESGLYTLVLRCRDAIKPGTPAHTFRKWVTSEVLPSIRKTGSYAAPGSADAKMDRLLALLEANLAQSQAIVDIATRALAPKPRRAPHRPVTPEETERARAMKADGMSGNEIARQLQRSTATVSWMVRGVPA